MKSVFKLFLFALFFQLCTGLSAAQKNIVYYCIENENIKNSISSADKNNYASLSEKFLENQSNLNEKIKQEDISNFKKFSNFFYISIRGSLICKKELLELHQLTLSRGAEPKVYAMFGIYREFLSDYIAIGEEFINTLIANESIFYTGSITHGEWLKKVGVANLSFNQKISELGADLQTASDDITYGRTPKFGRLSILIVP